MPASPDHLAIWATWAIVLIATAGVIIRPWKLPEAIWAVVGAALLVATGLLPVHAALSAVGKGSDVYLFLVGMMLLSEVARQEGLFDWLAAFAVRRSGGSGPRLFALVYAVGTVVTVFLSNDAAAVVLTPAVFAATRAARAEPLPYLFVCALIANAASFVLPVSNPANLVLYGHQMPPLTRWLGHFLLPSVMSIGATFMVLRWLDRRSLAAPINAAIEQPALRPGGWAALCGIVGTALVLLGASGLGLALGLPTFLSGLLTTALVLLTARVPPWQTLRGVSWLVLPLVAGLFVLVQGLEQTGAITVLADALHRAAAAGAGWTNLLSGFALAILCNLTNNLPAGLVAGQAITQGHLPTALVDSLLVGVDLGPNLSVTGSLATILWLNALRREGEDISSGRFLARGVVAMPPALLLALAALWLFS